MQELVILKNKEAVTTSLQVAESFEKKHQHVLRDIDALKRCVNFGQMFVEGNEPDSYGRNRRVFFISRDGFSCWLWGLQERKLSTSNKNTLKHSTKWKMLFARILFLKQLKI